MYEQLSGLLGLEGLIVTSVAVFPCGTRFVNTLPTMWSLIVTPCGGGL